MNLHKLTIDGRAVEVAAGATILQAAHKLGIEIPTLCHLPGLPPGASCMVCVVEVAGVHRLVPACAYPAGAGLAVQTDTPAVRAARRAAVELLMSEHVGDCEGLCQRGCPAHLNIPLMIRQIAAGRHAEALATVRRDIALPSVLGRICPAPCEKVCRRAKLDRPISICLLKRFAGDHGAEDVRDGTASATRIWRDDLRVVREPARAKGTDGTEPVPPDDKAHLPPASGRRVAVVGAGPAGLAATFYLRRRGHACDLFDDQPAPGGALREHVPAERLPRDVLDREIEHIRRLGVNFHKGVRIGRDRTLANLRQTYDAVILAVGTLDAAQAALLGAPMAARGLQADMHTYLTPLPGVFAIGGALRPLKMSVRACADGKECAFACDEFLKGAAVGGELRRFNCIIGKLTEEELREVSKQAVNRARVEPAAGLPGGFTAEEARAEAERCLHCDCRKADDCRLRDAVEYLGAEHHRFAEGERHPFELQIQANGLVFEPGKCIKCGLCVRVAQRHEEVPGISFIRRGFQMRISPPAGQTLAAALAEVAGEVIAACPTGALAGGSGE